MKKFTLNFIVLMLLCMVCVLVGCGNTESVSQSTTPTGTTTPTQTTTPTETTVEENVPNLRGQKFIIMCNKSSSSDPRSETYTGSWKEQKVALIEAAEAKYNIRVTYETYPATAVFGGARERWITDNAKNNTTTAHIYEMPSYSVALLAEAGAILALDDLIEQYGDETYWPEKASYGSVLGKQYSYDDSYPLVGQGIFYNISLYQEIMGEEAKLPSEMWLDGEWTWAKYTEVCNELLPAITAKGIEGAAVMGGRAYNWAYQMLGANGVHVVSSELKSELATEAGIDTLTYLNQLITVPSMWEWESASLSNATCPQFQAGNIVFHNGEPYWMSDTTKWAGYQFDMGFVPYPVGPNVSEDLNNYYINEVYGKNCYLVSSSYSKDKIPAGYLDMTFYDETIFRIWSDLQYFPDADETGYADVDEIIEEWEFTLLDLHYSPEGDNASMRAHESVMRKGYADYFYSLYWARSHDANKSFMLDLQTAILTGEIRSAMTDLVSRIHQEFLDTYVNLGLSSDYYSK